MARSLSKYDFRGAITAERNRRRIARAGEVCGRKLWTKDEDQVWRSLYPDYKAGLRKLRRRTYYALRNRARTLGIVKERHTWTGIEVNWLRRYYAKTTTSERTRAFPTVSKSALARAAYRFGATQRRPLKSTGHPILDNVRKRCRELNLTMGDLDRMAGTKGYFRNAAWLCRGTINVSKIARAVVALGGNLHADWR